MNLEIYKHLLATDIADAMPAGCAMDIAIQSIWQPAEHIFGLAYTVKCINRSNTHLHKAIYAAPENAIVVAQIDANDYAVAGGNVCAVAQQNNIQGFVIDGCVRDVGEILDLQFPVFARGVYPKPGGKTADGETQTSITCGGLAVNTGDLIVADEEGIVVVPRSDISKVLENALAKQQKAEKQTLSEWRAAHEEKIQKIV